MTTTINNQVVDQDHMLLISQMYPDVYTQIVPQGLYSKSADFFFFFSDYKLPMLNMNSLSLILSSSDKAATPP